MDENFCRSIADLTSFKDVVIYGAGNTGVNMLNIMNILGKKVLFFLDQDKEKQKSGFWGYEVKKPEDILKIDRSNIIILTAVGAQSEVRELLIGLGLQEGTEFVNPLPLCYQLCDAFDTLLGYSRSTDVNGFHTMREGEHNATNRNLLCLGGSNTDYSMYGITSWPKYLSELLEMEHHDITVLNGGVTGYNSSQELLKLIREGLELHPFLVISYSGINDMVKLPGMGAHGIENVWNNILNKKNLDSAMLANDFTITHGAQTQMDSAEYWYRNEKIMSYICRGFSIPFLGILQPSTYTKSSEERSFYEKRSLCANTERIENHFKKARDLIKNGAEKNIIDLTTLFDHKEDIYIDTCHVSERGNKIIAEAIYQIMKERKLI